MEADLLERTLVLVVDDHPESLQLLMDTLDSANVTVLVATGGAQALEQAARIMPEIILLDAVMPGMDGFETCRALKKGIAADVPVIFMTGLGDTNHVVQGLEAGGIDYLTKPIVPEELLARMRVHLLNARATRDVKVALDTGGRTMLAVDARGRIRWATPLARSMLAGLEDHAETEVPAALRAWLARLAAVDAGLSEQGLVITTQSPPARLRFRLLSRVNDDEMLLVIQQADPAEIERDGIGRLQQRMGLTQREAEVLYWLSLGKSNRDIADILGMSYRTVDKHLEHVYAKIGVESRAGAVAAATRITEK